MHISEARCDNEQKQNEWPNRESSSNNIWWQKNVVWRQNRNKYFWNVISEKILWVFNSITVLRHKPPNTLFVCTSFVKLFQKILLGNHSESLAMACTSTSVLIWSWTSFTTSTFYRQCLQNSIQYLESLDCLCHMYSIQINKMSLIRIQCNISLFYSYVFLSEKFNMFYRWGPNSSANHLRRFLSDPLSFSNFAWISSSMAFWWRRANGVLAHHDTNASSSSR